MTYSVKLADRIDGLLATVLGTDRKNMFGGICYLLNGNMFAGIHRDSLILRLGERGAAEALGAQHVSPADITGKPMKGWVTVRPAGFGSDDVLVEWLNEAMDFVSGMPPKARKGSAPRQ